MNCSQGETRQTASDDPAATVVVPQGVQIGPEHRPGIYRVTAWIASRPLTRPELDDAPDGLVRSRSQFELRIVP